MSFCTKCGKPNLPTDKFCTSCGTAFTVSPKLQQQTSVVTGPAASSKKNTWIILFIIGVLGLGTGAYFLFFNKKEKQNTPDVISTDKAVAPSIQDNYSQNNSPAQGQTDNSSQELSYTDEYWRLIYRSDCYIIVTGSFVEERIARDYVNTMKNYGHSNSGYLWIPEYPSLSGKQFYATFIGPYRSYEECESNLRTLKFNSRFWYGKKVSYNPEQIEIRIK